MFRWSKHLSQSFAKKINTSYIKVQSADSFRFRNNNNIDTCAH